MALHVRKYLTFVEEVFEAGGRSDGSPLRKVAIAAILKNPYAGRYVEDLSPLIEESADLGREFGKRAAEAMGSHKVQSYGKGALVGIDGEQEHANALLTTTFANPIRDAIGPAKAWLSSMTKFGSPGTTIDVPLASTKALYVRSHYDGMSLTFHDGPLADEIVVIICMANRGRINARVGGLKLDEVRTNDGLT